MPPTKEEVKDPLNNVDQLVVLRWKDNSQPLIPGKSSPLVEFADIHLLEVIIPITTHLSSIFRYILRIYCWEGVIIMVDLCCILITVHSF